LAECKEGQAKSQEGQDPPSAGRDQSVLKVEYTDTLPVRTRKDGREGGEWLPLLQDIQLHSRVGLYGKLGPFPTAKEAELWRKRAIAMAVYYMKRSQLQPSKIHTARRKEEAGFVIYVWFKEEANV